MEKRTEPTHKETAMTSEEKPLYHRVKAHPTARISPAASMVGDVTLGRDVTVFAGAHLRTQ